MNGVYSTNRRNLIKLSLGGVTATLLSPVTFGSALAQEKSVVRWISPRGNIEVLDDYAYWLAKEFGYFGDIDTTMEAGPIEATSNIKFVAQGQGDIGYPSPGVLSLGIEQGIDLVGVFNNCPTDVFNFAFRKGEKPANLKALEGKTVVVGTAGWKAIADPLLVQAGVDTTKVNYVAAGGAWGQVFAQGQGDAAFSWEGLRAQWLGQGLDFDWIIGRTFSKVPSNTFVIRRTDFEDETKRPVYIKFLKGWTMGLEFGHRHPLKTCQFTMDKIPALQSQMTPTVAADNMIQLDNVFMDRTGLGWGAHDMAAWQYFLDIAKQLGQVTKDIKAENIVKNDFIKEANDIDLERIDKDAASIILRDEYSTVDLDAVRARL